MKRKKLLIAILVMFLASTAFAPYPITYRNVNNPRLLTRMLQNRIGALDDSVADLEALSGGVYDNTGTGDIFYVDSGVAVDLAGTTWATAHDTLQDAVDACADNNGDIIYVAQNHEENIASAAALDFNKAGITVIGVGNGEDQPTISLISLLTATVQISAADVMLYNLRFLGNFTNGVTECLDITANGDGAIIAGCEFRETTNDKELLIMITLTAAADEVIIIGNRFIGIDGGNDSVAINMEGASNQTTISNNFFYGDWLDYVIKNGAQSISMLIENNVINNLDTGAGKLMSFHSSSTGSVVNNKCYGNGATFAFVGAAMSLTPDNVFMNTEVVTRTYEQMFGPFTGATSGLQGTTIYADLVLAQTDLDALLVDTIQLDVDVNDIEVQLAVVDGIVDNIFTYTGTTIPGTITALNATIAGLDDTGWYGFCTSDPSNTSKATCSTLANYGDDYFNTGWSLRCVWDQSGHGSAPEGETIDIVDYDSATGEFTVNYAFTAQLTTLDGIQLIQTDELNLDDLTMLGSAGRVIYVDSGTSGDGTGLTLENAFATLYLAEQSTLLAGDVVYIADGHAETIETGGITLNIANTSFIGMGEGDARPLFTADASSDEITLDNAGITIKNIRMRPGADKETSAIRVEDAGIGCTIENVAFVVAQGSDEEFEICIDVDEAADKLTVKNCTYYNTQATAADVDSFIDLTEAAIQNCKIIGCDVFGTFAVAPINWGAAIPLNLVIQDNVISNTTASAYAIYGTGAATGVLVGNRLYSDDYATMLDPGSLMCIDNWGTDAIDQQGIAIPISAETSDVGGVADGSNLERLEYLQQLTTDAIARFGVGTGSVFYVDSDQSGSTGIDWANAVATIDDAVNLCTADRGDFIFVAPDHVEDLDTTDPDFDQDGITVIGLGEGEQRPVLSWDTTSDIFTIDACDITVRNFVFKAHLPDVVKGIDITANSENAIIEDCLFTIETEGTDEFLIAINVGADADNLVVRNCEFFQGGGNATEAILFDGTCDYAVIEGCKIFGDYSTACIYGDVTGAGVMLVIRDNILYNGDITVGLNTEPCIELKDTTTGFIINNTCICDEGVPEEAIVAADCYLAGNTYTETEGIAGSVPIGKTYAVDALAALGVAHVGKIIYVDSGEVSTVENGMTWGTATDTLEEAIDLATTNVGDVIFIAPGHTETMGAAADEVDIDKNNVTVIGLGKGDARPLFDFTGDVTGAFAVSGDNVTIRNLRFHANILDVNEAIEVEAGAVNCHIEYCMFDLETPNTDYFLECIDSSGAASDELHVTGCEFYMGEGSCNAAIYFKDSDHAVIKDNISYGDYAIANINQITTASNHLTIENNVLFNGTIGGNTGLNAQPGIEMLGSTTGIIRFNHIGCNLATKAASIVADDCYLFENYYNEDESSAGTGGIIGTASDDDAE